MMIVLPMETNGLATVQKDFVQSTMSLILSQLQTTEVELKMPKFSIDYSTDMTSILKEVKYNTFHNEEIHAKTQLYTKFQMGIHDLFSQNADLSQMINSGGKPQVNSVVHKTRIQVDQNGSIASAATGAMVVPLMGSSGVRMTINHPFMFIIREVDSGAILFAGRVEEPFSPRAPETNYNQQQHQHRNPVVNGNNQRQPSGSRPNNPQRVKPNQPTKNNNGEAQINVYNTPRPSINQFLQTNPNTYIGRPALPPYSQIDRTSTSNRNSQILYQQASLPQNINQNPQSINQQYTNLNTQNTNYNAQNTDQYTPNDNYALYANQNTPNNREQYNQNIPNTNPNTQSTYQNTQNTNAQYINPSIQINKKPNYLQSNNFPYNLPNDARSSTANYQDKINFPVT